MGSPEKNGEAIFHFLVQFYDQQTSKRLLNLNKLGEREAVNHREALDKHIM